MNALKAWYKRVFPDVEQEINALLKDYTSVADFGCGRNSPLRRILPNSELIGIDIYKPDIEEARQKNTHDKYINADVISVSKQEIGKVECAIALDLIEHLEKEDGLKLLETMEAVAEKIVILFTPVGFVEQGAHEGNPYQVHRSGWVPEEFVTRGYQVIGVHGWKPLRGDLAKVKFFPTYFWTVISDLTQKIVRKRPKYAYHMLCVKRLK